ncbi:MAG: hypothetical protein JEZ05_06345 [Tenericutes bacterium]|nr:hypothetical protein [Mycoplasmatota bacterium]
MKKLSIFATTLLFVITMMLSVNVTYAYESQDDLIQEHSADMNNGYDETLQVLSNSTYQFNIVIDSAYEHDVDNNPDSNLELEFMGQNFYYNESMSPSEWTTYGDYTTTFSTGPTETEIDFAYLVYGDQGSQYWDDFIDVQLFFVESNGAVDEIAPSYSYSNFSVDTPYYDLVTETEIRNQLSATDDEDGDVTSRIQVYSDEYTNETKEVGGDYFIIYMVDDTSGNSAYLQVDINIYDDVKPYMTYGGTTYQDGDAMTWTWYDTEMEYFGTNDFETYLQNAIFYDENDFSEGLQIPFIEEIPSEISYFNGADSADFPDTPIMLLLGTPDTYAFIETITDESGNTFTLNHTINVLSNTLPIINGSATYEMEVLNFDPMTSIDSILESYSAIDTEDGDLSTSLVIDFIGLLPDEIPTLGSSFTVTLTVTDSNYGTTTKDITVHMVDSTQPIFKVDNIETSTYTLNVFMSNTDALQTFIDSIVATDLYDGILTSSIVIPELPSFITPHTTTMTLTCEDPQGNSSTLVLNVNVIDDIAPVINGATKIVKGITATLTLSDITAALSSTDNIDGILNVEVVTDGYTGNSGNLGSYVVQYKATDSSGNIAYHDVRVWVVDNQAPVWILNDFFVNITANQAMARTELVSLLQASGMIGSDISYTVTFLTDEYSGNESIEGAYQVMMNVTYEDGSEDTISVQLNVPEVEDDSDVIVVTPDEPMTGLQKTIQWVKTAASNGWNFIKSIGNGIKTGAVWTYDHLLKPAWDFIFTKDTTDDIPVYTTDPVDNIANTGTTTLTPTQLPDVTTTESPFNQV